MDRPGRLLAGALLWSALTLAGCGGQSQPASPPQSHGSGRQTGADLPTAGATRATTTTEPAPTAADPYSASAGDSAAALVASVRSYVSAIDRHDGRALCSLLVPGALHGVRLPGNGSGCAARVSASIGHSAAAAQAWRRTRIRRIGPVEIDPNQPVAARVRALVVHSFAGDREPSIEDDLIYLRYSGRRWLVVKPSSTFYRAIGARDVPLSALTPPAR